MVPADLVFNPAWWHRNYDISFESEFYLDLETRIEIDLQMRHVLYDRYGLGQARPGPRPVIGSLHVAGGFVLPALFGVEIRFSPDAAPWPTPAEMSREQILDLETPDLQNTWPMAELLADMETLERRFGRVVGDVDTDGLLNTALHLRGQQLYLDFYQDPELVHHLFGVLAETTYGVAEAFRARTGSCAIATNRSIVNVNPGIYLHSNCSVQMISPDTYRRFLLPYELFLAERLQPYGIHHCGNNLHAYTNVYGEVPVAFFDVGWGSDVALCRQAFPDAFLNLRLSPVRMLQEPAEVIRQDAEQLLQAAGSPNNLGICCINMDAGTPDANIHTMLQVAADYS